MTPACMGGWCRVRERCANYRTPALSPDLEPAERLCLPKQDGVCGDFPVRLSSPVGTWKRINDPALLRPAEYFDALQA